jgi:hypothetical protein
MCTWAGEHAVELEDGSGDCPWRAVSGGQPLPGHRQIQHARHALQGVEPRPPDIQRIVTLRFGTGRQRMGLERWTNPKLSRRACTCEYRLRSCRGKSAGLENPHVRFAIFSSLYSSSVTLCPHSARGVYVPSHHGLHVAVVVHTARASRTRPRPAAPAFSAPSTLTAAPARAGETPARGGRAAAAHRRVVHVQCE